MMIGECPSIHRDPRFTVGRFLVNEGKCEQAADIFATLLKEVRRYYGEDSIESSPAYYEYGNAIFRSVSTSTEYSESGPRSIALRDTVAAAAGNISLNTRQSNLVNSSIPVQSDGAKDKQYVFEDIELALVLMETAWSILDKFIQDEKDGTGRLRAWADDQQPRFLTGIGDVLSVLRRPADAVDAYCRALSYRELLFEKLDLRHQVHDSSLSALKSRRQVVELNVLIAEELIKSPLSNDLVTTESRQLLVHSKDRINYARGYYEKARDELQEAVLLMGEMVATSIDISSEKSGICFAATLLMGLGVTLASIEDYDDEASNSKETRPEKVVERKCADYT